MPSISRDSRLRASSPDGAREVATDAELAERTLGVLHLTQPARSSPRARIAVASTRHGAADATTSADREPARRSLTPLRHGDVNDGDSTPYSRGRLHRGRCPPTSSALVPSTTTARPRSRANGAACSKARLAEVAPVRGVGHLPRIVHLVGVDLSPTGPGVRQHRVPRAIVLRGMRRTGQ